jgi:hypothetical protein
MWKRPGRWSAGNTRQARCPSNARRVSSIKPRVEWLEERLVPATLSVTSTTDAVGQAGTLRNAIQQANTNGQLSNTINIMTPGTYTLSPGTPGETDNQAGELAFLPSNGSQLTINNLSGGTVTIQGSGSSRLFDINPANTSLAASVTFNNPGNNPNGPIVFQGGSISGSGVAGSGGAIRAQGTINLTVSNVGFLSNAAAAFGGAIANAGNGTVVLQNSTFQSNAAQEGGAFGDVNNLGALSVSNSLFVTNKATDSGGGISEGGPNTTISNSEFKGNTASNDGGAVMAFGAGVSASNSTFTQNVANQGGAIFVETTGPSSLTNSTFTRNTAQGNLGNGGAIEAFTGALSVVNDTINNNAATAGGGIYFYGFNGNSVFVQNTILIGDTATTGPEVNNTNNPALAFTDGGGNVINTTNGATGFTSATDQIGPFGSLLVGLTNNGGPTVGVLLGSAGLSFTLETEALLPGSVPIGKGIANGLTTDERGFARPTTPDVGAFQFQNAILTISVTPSTTNVAQGSTVNLNVTVSNVGNTNLPSDNTVFTLTLPSALTLSSVTSPNGQTNSVSGSTLTLPVGALSAHSSATWVVTATGTTVANGVTVTASLNSPDVNPSATGVVLNAQTTLNVIPNIPTPVGALTVFAFGFTPNFQLVFFDVDTVGDVFYQAFSFTSLGSAVFVNTKPVFSNLFNNNGAIAGFVISSTNQPYIMEILSYTNPYVFNGLVAAILAML